MVYSVTEMDLETKLKGLVTSEMPTLIHIRELTHPDGYEILSVRRTSTKYGRAIAATILKECEKGGAPIKRVTFLPRRFETCLSDQDLDQINQLPKKYIIKCSNVSLKSPEVTICLNKM